MMKNNQVPQFKVWCHDTKKWFNNDLLYINSKNEVVYISTKSNHKILYAQPLENITICRFIGQFDINKCPIYEHDIYFLNKDKKEIRVIEYSNYIYQSPSMCGFQIDMKQLYAQFSSKDYYPIYDRHAMYAIYHTLEIIGSKFEHGYLIEQ